MSGISNFFKRKNKLNYNNKIFCPVAKKWYVEQNPADICPACGEKLTDDGFPENIGHIIEKVEEY
jgi:rRNA maturation endonuclease Nob1